MHLNVLDKNQTALLPLLSVFNKDFGLVGGTAIALHIGHRQSIDFDLFTTKPFNNLTIQKILLQSAKIDHVLVDVKDEYTVVVDEVKITFLCFPFSVEFTKNLDNWLKIADLTILAALKAYALGRRAKWKDYVDLYFVIRDYLTIQEIINKAKDIFGENFNEKNFKVQLAYFDDLDYSEKVILTEGNQVKDSEIKKALSEYSLEK